MSGNFIYIALALILADNVVFSHLFGVETLFVKSKTLKSVTLYSIFLFVISVVSGIISSAVTQLVNFASLGVLSTFIAVLVNFGVLILAKIILSKYGSNLLSEFSDSIPLLSISCISLISVQISKINELTFLQSIVVVFAASLGYLVALYLIESIKDKLEGKKVSLIILSASFAALAFSGFVGIGL